MIYIRNLLDLKCDTDGCKEQQGFPANFDESIPQLKQQARGYGWVFKRGKRVYCPICAAKYLGRKPRPDYFSSDKGFFHE